MNQGTSSQSGTETQSSSGSVWHRWDPHLHAPGTLLNDQFNGDWDGYIRRINSSRPAIRALGVTDYFCIRTYRAAKRRFNAGELPQVKFLFPNVEMRLDIKTTKQIPINLHFLFSPDDPDHEETIERILGRLEFKVGGQTYQCNLDRFAALGCILEPRVTDREKLITLGAMQFKVSLDQIKALFDSESWLRANCLVAVAGGSNDGTSGLQHDTSYTLVRREIESFADIIFASTPSQRAFWLGKTEKTPRSEIEATYRSLKPCLHGSDCHSESTTGAPSLDRFCWLKGDLCFETLRQVVLEPDRRVWIGDKQPIDGGGLATIAGMRVEKAPWLATSSIPLNPGLIAVIGSRGSGKSALVEIIAHGARCPGDAMADASFLTRAEEHLDDATVELSWADGADSSPVLLTAPNSGDDAWLYDGVRYLSQHFVERLCAGAGLATELRREIERVVFEATDRSLRMNATTFEELVDLMSQPIADRRAELRSNISEVTQAIVEEEKRIAGLADLKIDRQRQEKTLGNARTDLAKLIPKGAEDRAKRLSALKSAVTQATERVELLRRRRRALGDLEAEVQNNRSVVASSRLLQLKQRFEDAGLATTDWEKFALRYGDDVDAILRREIASAEKAIEKGVQGDDPLHLNQAGVAIDKWPLNAVVKRRDEVKKEVGIDTERLRRYQLLQRQIGQLESALKRLDGEIERGTGAAERKREKSENRRLLYKAIFETFVDEEAVLNELYAPLRKDLVDGIGALGKLRFVVERRVDVDAWIRRGEGLLDLRKATRFKGEGALQSIAEQGLVPAWVSGSPEAISACMQKFIEEYRKDFIDAMPSSIETNQRGQWRQELAAWVYDTAHMKMLYSLRYDGVPIEKLSPGTRGIVLLLLYLVLDKSDLRPLIIDQPEENLDPHSVFDELVPHFRDARDRRQVIIVTHNANLVVNTDADQVVVAHATAAENGGLPEISYRSGSLENPAIRKFVCEILEGGERAFEDRAKRYRFRWPAK